VLLQDPGPSYQPLEAVDFHSVLEKVERAALARLLARYGG